jgi:hypothetical protein
MGKGQSDLMGLVVIVFIFIIAISFILFFTLKEDNNDFLQDFDTSLHASNSIASMLQTTTNCNDLPMSKIIEQCMWTNIWNVQCAINKNNPELKPCDYASGIIEFILKESLFVQGFDYNFYLYSENDLDAEGNIVDAKIVIPNPPLTCTGNVVSETYTLAYRGGNLFITLEICEREI